MYAALETLATYPKGTCGEGAVACLPPNLVRGPLGAEIAIGFLFFLIGTKRWLVGFSY